MTIPEMRAAIAAAAPAIRAAAANARPDDQRERDVMIRDARARLDRINTAA